MQKLIKTITTTERYVPCGTLDELTVSALRGSGFEFKYGVFYRSHTDFTEIDEETVCAKAIGRIA